MQHNKIKLGYWKSRGRA